MQERGRDRPGRTPSQIVVVAEREVSRETPVGRSNCKQASEKIDAEVEREKMGVGERRRGKREGDCFVP